MHCLEFLCNEIKSSTLLGVFNAAHFAPPRNATYGSQGRYGTVKKTLKEWHPTKCVAATPKKK